ncbi:MAG: hypothetical protein ACR2RF_25280 [Geminicoccaceae bacterium]
MFDLNLTNQEHAELLKIAASQYVSLAVRCAGQDVQVDNPYYFWGSGISRKTKSRENAQKALFAKILMKMTGKEAPKADKEQFIVPYHSKDKRHKGYLMYSRTKARKYRAELLATII